MTNRHPSDLTAIYPIKEVGDSNRINKAESLNIKEKTSKLVRKV